MNSQKALIREHLLSGSAITPLQALQAYGCFRLGARIWDLRKDGLEIESRTIELDGKRFSEYKLKKGE